MTTTRVSATIVGVTSPSAAPRTARFRHPAALAVAAFITLVGAIPLAAQSWGYTPILAVPLAFTLWAWRAGTDADADGVVVRALLGNRRIPWSEIAALIPDGDRRVRAGLVSGGVIRLPAVTAADLPRLVAASGRQLDGGAAQ